MSELYLLQDVSIVDPVVRFDVLNLMLCFEMTVLALIWWKVFNPKDPVFQYIIDSAEPAVEAPGEKNHDEPVLLPPIKDREVVVQL